MKYELNKNLFFIDGYYYATSDDEIKEADWFTDNNKSLKQSYRLSHIQFANPKKIEFTTNPNIDLPKIVLEDKEYEAEELLVLLMATKPIPANGQMKI